MGSRNRDDDLESSPKRVKIDTSSATSGSLRSLDREISPPRRTFARQIDDKLSLLPSEASQPESSRAGHPVSTTGVSQNHHSTQTTFIASPFQLTRIRDLPEAQNRDTVTLEAIVRDPLIAELWSFNYLTDVDFLINALDPDTKDLTEVHIVHGFWKREDSASIKEQAAKYRNVVLHAAYMPEMYGTHHTKMMILIKHDDTAQIVIHTANMIQQDWRNLTQAVWRSPVLSKQAQNSSELQVEARLGSGSRFKRDFLAYLQAYDMNARNFCRPIVEKLKTFDFTPVKGVLIGSVPGRYPVQSQRQTVWGWPALRKILKEVPVKPSNFAEIVVQISSIATVGQSNSWLNDTLFASLDAPSPPTNKPSHKIIFPTADEIRRSLDGYSSGHSIHMKIQTPAQAKQLKYMKPMLHHWAGDGAQHDSENGKEIREAGRRRAAPHIKTYLRFSDAAQTRIDWAFVTSANISKQAWGEAINADDKVRISSYELGVLAWPELYGTGAIMTPVFKSDLPTPADAKPHDKIVVGFRMPYDLPLVRYTRGDEPWCATSSYDEPDWMGQSWRT